MFGIESLPGTLHATVLVGSVLAESVALYLGYGGLTRLVGPTVTNALRGK